MLNVEDFIDKYKSYSDEELYQIYETIDNYSEDAKTALYKVIEKRGGLDLILNNLKNKEAIQREILRIRNETTKLCSKETNAEFIKTLVRSEILPKQQIDGIIDARYAGFTGYLKSNSFDVKTAILAALGIVISSIIGGILWALLITQSQKIPVILILGVVALCYFIIILFTRKSKVSPIVIVSTVIAVVISYLIGMLLYPI